MCNTNKRGNYAIRSICKQPNTGWHWRSVGCPTVWRCAMRTVIKRAVITLYLHDYISARATAAAFRLLNLREA